MKIKLLSSTLIALTFIPMAQALEKVKVMYATTPNVRSSHGGNKNTNAKIRAKQVLLEQSNTASSTGINWRKGPNFKSTYNDSNVTVYDQLIRMLTHDDLLPLRNRRDAKNADIMQLHCEYTDGDRFAGIATLGGYVSVVRGDLLGVLSAPFSLTHVHEFGHNLRADHYNGYCMTGQRRTIMERNSGSCSSSTRLNLFSSATKLLNGASTGNSSNDNRTRMRTQRFLTSDFR